MIEPHYYIDYIDIVLTDTHWCNVLRDQLYICYDPMEWYDEHGDVFASLPLPKNWTVA